MSIKQIKVGSTNHNLVASNVAYGTCPTAAATAAKVITVSGGWELVAGAIISVKFTYTNSASNPTFNVNSTGAKSVWYNTALITTGSLSYAGYAGRVAQYMYDGTQYVFQGWAYDSNSDAKTASGTSTGTKLFLIGAASQSTSGQTTKSNANCYIGTDNCLYSGGTKVSTEGHTHSYAATTHNHAASEITSGTLGVARGGTGVTSNPSMLTNLGSTSAASVFAASPRPGITGTLGIANGGTGATTAAAARTALGITTPTVLTGTIPVSGWTENSDTGVKSLSVAISGVTAAHTAKVDHSSASITGTADSYATFVEEENQYLERITNGYAETYAGGIKFYIFGDAPTVAIPIVVEVV